MSEKVAITLYGKQHSIFQDWLHSGKNCISVVPVGSGKTFMAALMLPIAASDPTISKNKDVIYSAPTHQMIKNLVWVDLVSNCKKWFGVRDSDVNNSDLTIKMPGGNFIKCLSAEQREKWRGLNVGLWVSDETAISNEASTMEIMNRLRPKVGATIEDKGRVIFISTPAGANHFYDLVQKARLDPENWVVHHYNYMEMASGNRKFIEDQRRILSAVKFAVDYMCSFEQVTDQVFYAFNPAHHMVDLDDDGRSTLWSFHDFNKRVCCALVGRVIDGGTETGRLEILREYAIPDCGTEQMAQAIRKDFPKREIMSVIDMSGAQTNRDTTSPFGVTDKTILEKYGFRIVNMNKRNPLISDTDNSANALLARGGLLIGWNLHQTKKALQTYHFKDGTRKELVKYTNEYAFIDGLGDCLRYAAHHHFPIQHRAHSSPSQAWDRTGPRVGEEYLPDHKRTSNRGVPTVEHLLNPQSSGLDGCSWD